MAPDPLPNGDEWKCGAGKKARCCRYLTFSVAGFHCTRDNNPSLARFIETRRDMTAARLPKETYPNCQLPVQ